MPRLPSGLHFAIDPTPLNCLVEQASNGIFSEELKSIDHVDHMLRYIDVLYFSSPSSATVAREYAPQSGLPPEGMKPHPSGYTLYSIREAIAKWSFADQEAFQSFLDEPRTIDFIHSHFDAVMKAKTRLHSRLPSPFDTLAAFSRFQNVQECSPKFYQKHYDAIDMTVGFIGFLGSEDERFSQIFRFSNAPLPEISSTLERAIPQMNLDQRMLDFIDSTMTVVMQKLHGVVQDPELPPYLQDCVWPIVGAFEP